MRRLSAFPRGAIISRARELDGCASAGASRRAAPLAARATIFSQPPRPSSDPRAMIDGARTAEGYRVYEYMYEYARTRARRTRRRRCGYVVGESANKDSSSL